MANDPELFDGPDGDGGSFALPAQLRDPFGVLRRQIGWILGSLVLLLIATGVGTYYAPLTYEARATILLSAKSIPDEFVPDTIIANIIEQFEAIRGEVFSRDGLTKIIDETGLYAEEREKTSIAALAARLRQDLTVRQLSGPVNWRSAPSSVAFEVKLEGTEPELLASVVNKTVAELINENIEYRSRQARVTSEFMRREFERADRALREHQRKLAEFRAENRGSLPEERETAIAKLDRLEEQRRSAILRLNDYRGQLERIDERPGGIDEQTSLEALRDRLQNAETLYTAEHPTVVSLRRQVEAAEKRRASGSGAPGSESVEERATVSKGIELEQMRLEQIDEEVAALEARIARTPKIADEYEALVREEQILRENYIEYLRKLKNAELALSLESAQQGAQLTRTESAIAPTRPIVPRWQFAAAGALVSLGIALLIGAARELLNPVIIDEQHLEDALSIPSLGSVARIT